MNIPYHMLQETEAAAGKLGAGWPAAGTAGL